MLGLRFDKAGHLVRTAGLDQEADGVFAMMVIGDDREELALLAAGRPAGRAVAGLAADFGQSCDQASPATSIQPASNGRAA